MKWNKVPDHCRSREVLPKDGEFLALWKGSICLCEYSMEENCFWIAMYPSQQAGFMRVSHDREGKFTHWCQLELPEDY